MSRSRFVVADALKALGNVSLLRSLSGLLLASSPPSAAGHLGLVRAHPGIADLNAFLTPEALLLDAAHVLGAAALRHQPIIGGLARTVRDLAPEVHAKAEAADDGETAKAGRLYLALLDAEEGRFEDALGALARQAAEDPHRDAPRLSAAAVCEMLGRTDEAERWVACIAGDMPPREYASFQYALVVTALGGAPGAVGSSQGAVAAAALRFVYDKLWGAACDGEMPMLKKMLVTGLLNRVIKRKLREDAVVDMPGVLQLLLFGARGSEGPGCPVPVLPPADGAPFVLRASQALLSAVVLGAPPLSAERIRAATSVAERELAHAVEGWDAPAAADLRLLLAFLAARDGRFDDAIQKYLEAAREDPSDPRPHYLGYLLFSVADNAVESDKWKANYERLASGSPAEERVVHETLRGEMVIALALGGASTPFLLCETVGAAGSRLEAALLCRALAEDVPVVERLDLLAIRAFVGEICSMVAPRKMESP